MTDRVTATMDAVPVIDPADPLCVAAPSGQVMITAVEVGEDAGQRWVEVTVADPACGDPTFRVFNPPALVPDPAGELERGGIRYRHDPLAALAEVIASNGGQRKGRIP